ncbi:MAG: signal peptidase I [Actinomycetes bacterium]
MENKVEVSPGVSIVDSNLGSSRDSHILLTVVENGISMTHYFNAGELQQVSPDHLLEGFETEEPKKNLSSSARIFSKTALFAGYSLAIALFAFSMLSFSGITKARVVLTGSMAPAIHVGDVIITTPIKYKNPKIGDVIAYQAKRFNGAPVGVFSHRIIGGNISTGFIVKGDINKLPDSQRPVSKDILGVVIFVFPYIGNLLTPKALFLLVPTIFGFYLIVDAMRNVE